MFINLSENAKEVKALNTVALVPVTEASAVRWCCAERTAPSTLTDLSS